jgi:hypothetical protein
VTILILSGDDDVHADAVEEALLGLGAPVVRFDPAHYPAQAGLSVRIGGPGVTGAVLQHAQTRIELDGLRSVWVHRPGMPRPPEALEGTPAGAVVQAEAASVLADVWELLEVPFVPATPAVLRVASLKLRQLALAVRLGFAIPDTLVSNDPDAILAVWAAGDRVITKRAVPGQRVIAPDGRETSRGTLAVRPADLVDIEAVRLAPIMVQPMVDKAVEVRATVVGDEVFAAAIHSQQTHHTRIDFRRYDNEHTPITPYPLAPDLHDRCVQLTRVLGLRYSAMDLIVTPTGQVVFLEANPVGQFRWIERTAGLPISRALAALLVRGGQA